MGAKLSVKTKCNDEHETRIRGCAGDKDFSMRYFVPDTYTHNQRKSMKDKFKSTFDDCVSKSNEKLMKCSKPPTLLSRKQMRELDWRKKLDLLRDHRNYVLRVEGGGGVKHLQARRAYNAHLINAADDFV